MALGKTNEHISHGKVPLSKFNKFHSSIHIMTPKKDLKVAILGPVGVRGPLICLDAHASNARSFLV